MIEKEDLTERFSRWSLNQVEYLLGHMDGFVDDDNKVLRERARQFSAATGLDQVETLIEASPNDPTLPQRLLERLAVFFDAGLLLQRGPSEDNANWWATDLIWRGLVFHLDLKDQVQANHIMPQIAPLQVQKAPAAKFLQELKMPFLSPSPEADAYLLKPTPTLAYVLISGLAGPWSVDHLAHAQRLINKCFLY